MCDTVHIATWHTRILNGLNKNSCAFLAPKTFSAMLERVCMHSQNGLSLEQTFVQNITNFVHHLHSDILYHIICITMRTILKIHDVSKIILLPNNFLQLVIERKYPLQMEEVKLSL